MKDKTLKLAREAGLVEYYDGVWFTCGGLSVVRDFEALVRADERARLQPKKTKAEEDEYCHGDERYYANE